MLDRVMVNLLDHRAVSGVLLKVHHDKFVLADPFLHEEGQEPARMDGSVYIDRSMVAFMQATPPKGG